MFLQALSIEVAGCRKIFLPGGSGAGGIFSWGGRVQNHFSDLKFFFDFKFQITSILIFSSFKVPYERFLFKDFKTGLTFWHLWFFNFQNLLRISYLNFKAVLALPKTARSAQTHKSISFIWMFRVLGVYNFGPDIKFFHPFDNWERRKIVRFLLYLPTFTRIIPKIRIICNAAPRLQPYYYMYFLLLW